MTLKTLEDGSAMLFSHGLVLTVLPQESSESGTQMLEVHAYDNYGTNSINQMKLSLSCPAQELSFFTGTSLKKCFLNLLELVATVWSSHRKDLREMESQEKLTLLLTEFSSMLKQPAVFPLRNSSLDLELKTMPLDTWDNLVVISQRSNPIAGFPKSTKQEQLSLS